MLTDKNLGENGATLERSGTKSLVGLAKQTGISALSPQVTQNFCIFIHIS
jgi:hypothetical protein